VSDGDLIDLIYEYAADHKSFDTEFVDSISEALEQYGELTYSQSSACENIVKRFRMEHWKRDKERANNMPNICW